METIPFSHPEYYDKLALRLMSYNEVALLVKKKLDKYLPQAHRILDLACGTGNLTISLAQEGYELTGLDLSAHMLHHAQQKTAAAGLNIDYLAQDMVEPYPIAQVDAVTCFYTTLNFLNSSRLLEKCFSNVHAALSPNGLFMFDQFTPSRMRRVFNGVDRVDLDELYVVTCSKHVAADQIVLELNFFHKESDGYYRREDEIQHMRIHPFEELEQELNKAGFVVLEAEEMYPAGISYRGFSECHLFIAQKAGQSQAV